VPAACGAHDLGMDIQRLNLTAGVENRPTFETGRIFITLPSLFISCTSTTWIAGDSVAPLAPFPSGHDQ
jgi:hypothetical protein